jgi:hypothetical protein
MHEEMEMATGTGEGPVAAPNHPDAFLVFEWDTTQKGDEVAGS